MPGPLVAGIEEKFVFTMKNPYVLEEIVFSYIKTHKETSTLKLVEACQSQGYTKQGVYRVLRKLRIDGKILWTREYVAVNLLWLHRELESLAKILPERSVIFETFAQKRTYTMKTLSELDDVWGQIFASLLPSAPDLTHALFYDLHNYTYVHKIPVVEEYIRLLYSKVTKICLLVGSESLLDQKLKQLMKNVAVHCIPKKWNCFIAVFNDYVLYNHVDKKIWKEIDAVFRQGDIEKAREEIIFLSQKKGNYKIVVEKNATKAREIEKVFAKYFVLSPHAPTHTVHKT